jgi:hypothetical protein
MGHAQRKENSSDEQNTQHEIDYSVKNEYSIICRFLHGCLSEESRLPLSENRARVGRPEPMRKKITGGWRKLHK